MRLARIGFLTLYATGHLNPSIAFARALRNHGHEPVFFNLLDTQAAVEAAGLPFVPYGQAEYPAGSLQESMRKTAELTGQAAFAQYIQRMLTFFRAGFRELPELVRREQLDLMIVDQVHYAGGTIAAHVGVPFVSLANALLVNREDMIPPPVMPWPFERSAAAAERNGKGWAGVDGAMSPLLAQLNEQRREWNLPEYRNLLEDSFSPLAQICQMPSVFDFPRADAPATLHFVGHMQDGQTSNDVPFDWEWLDGRPLIYASCGTLQNRLEPVFRTMIEACAPLPAQTVIALGKGGFAPSDFGEVAPNIRLVSFAPQQALLRRASLCITHAGLNTTLDCLQAGVPMVAVPIASEQPGIAMRIAHLGAGKVVPLAELDAPRLGAAVQAVLTQAAYREAAAGIAREIAALNSTELAVEIVERVLKS